MGVWHVAVVALRIADDHSVVEADGQAVVSRLDQAELELMRRHQTAGRPDLFVVHPDGGFPARTFEKQFHAAPLPSGGDFDIALIPCGAEVVARGL